MRNAIFRLTLFDWLHAKVWIVLLTVVLIGAVAAPLLSDPALPTLAGPIRGQITYGIVFVTLAFYLPGLAAEIGRAQAQRNQRLYWRAQGVSDFQYFAALLGALFAPLFLLIVAAGVLIRCLGASELATSSLVQGMVLTALAAYVCVPLALGLSQRIAATVSAIVAILLNLLGYYGPSICDFLRANPKLATGPRTAIEIASSVLPHLRLGDQAERITFAWAPIPAGWFWASVGYLLLWIVISSGIGFWAFRKR